MIKAVIDCDEHENPKEISDHLRSFIRLAIASSALPVNAGDLIDMTAWGKYAFHGSKWYSEFLLELGGRTFIIVDSNHAPMSWLKDLFRAAPNVLIVKSFEFEYAPGKVLHVRHGHEWCLDWKILQFLVPPVVGFMTTYFPKTWYKIAKACGWTPSEVKKEKKYHFVVQRIWTRATQFALERGEELQKEVTVLSAHTHAVGIRLGMFKTESPRVIQIDPGTLWIGSYVEVDGDIKLKRLES